MHFMDSIFIFGLALILFGPKKLPEIGRQIGKIVLEFRKASNEFKMQIEDELRASEQADRQKKIAEETAALNAGVLPVAAALPEGTQPELMQPAVTQLGVLETSAPTALTIQPPSTGEQVSTDSPYGPGTTYAPPFRTGAEQLAAVIVQSPGEDPNPDAIAEIYPPANAAPTAAEAPVNSEVHPMSSEPAPAPPDRHTSTPLERPVQETDQAPIHHG